MAFFKDVSFRNARTDLIGLLRNTGKHSPWLFLAACMPTAIIIYTFYIDALVKGTPPPRRAAPPPPHDGELHGLVVRHRLLGRLVLHRAPRAGVHVDGRIQHHIEAAAVRGAWSGEQGG